MKKLLSIILSLLMVVSCMTCLFTSPASVASAASPSVSVTGENLLADLSPDDFTNVDGNANTVDTAQITVDTETVNAIRFRAGSQKIYFVMNLTEGRKYNLSFNLQGNVKLEGFRAYKLSDFVTTSNAPQNNGTYLLNDWTGGTNVTTAKTYSYTLEPDATTDYVFRFNFAGKVDSAGENYDYFYNYNLTTATEVSANVVGNGAASVVAGENNSLTFTATPYGDSSFLGWYDAEGTNLLSKDATYTYTGEVVANPVTAKFNGTNLAAGLTYEDWKEDGPNSPTPEAGDSRYGGNSTKIIKSAYQAVYLPIGSVLEADKTYNLELSYKGILTLNEISVVDAATAAFSTTDSGQLTVGTSRISGKADISAVTTADTWHTIKVSFTPTATCSTAAVYVRFNGYFSGYSADPWGTISDISLYQPLPKYNVTANADGNGTAIASVATAIEGTEVTFTATAFDGESFLGWYNGDDKVSEDATYTATVGNADLALTAKFTKINLLGSIAPTDFIHKGGAHTFATTTVGDATAIVTDKSAQYQTYYFKVNLTAGVTYDFSYYVKSNALYRATRVCLVSKLTDADKPTSTDNTYLVNDWRDANPLDASAGIERTYSFTAQETGEYAFMTAFNANGTSAVEGINPAYFYNFSLKEVKEYAATATADGNGTANASIAKGVTGTEVTFTAVAAENNKFVGWYNGDDKVSDDATYTTTIGDADLNLTAKFVRTYNVTATADGNGTATASAATATEGTEVTFTATAFDGESFLGWYNGVDKVSEDATYTATVGTADIALTAKFTKINLLGGLKASDFTHQSQWPNAEKLSDATIAVGEEEVSAIKFANAHYQVFYFTKELTAGVTYKYSFNVKSANVKYHGTRVFKASEIISGGDSYASSSGSGYLINAILASSIDVSAGVERSFDTFTPTETDTYAFLIKFDSLIDSTAEDKDAYFYNFRLIEVIPEYDVTVSTEGNGKAATSAATVQKGNDVTVTATAGADEIFLGWYNGDELVSTSATYTTTVNADLSLVAKFTGTNHLADIEAADFVHQNSSPNPAKLSDTTITVGDKKVNAIQFAGAAYQVFYFTKELTKGVTYKYSYSVKSNCNYHGTRMFKASEIITGGDSTASTSGEGYLINAFTAGTTDISAGKDMTFDTFTPDETTTYAFFIKFNALADSTATDKNAYIYNLSLTEVGGDDIPMANFKGNSIRATGSQALRFKFTNVNTDLFDAYAGYEVKEFGALAIRTKYLGDAELTVDGEYTYSGKAKAPVKGTFTADDISEDGTISLALYNLGTIKYADGSVKSTDFTAYGENYTVRMYAVLINPETQEEITVYGAEQTANVFAVMNAILSSTATDDQTVADQTAINSILASAATDSNGKTVKALYDEAYPQQ